MIVSKDQKELYDSEGYMILEGVIPPNQLEMMRQECSYFLGYKDAEMDAEGKTVSGITHRGKRYFISQMYRKSPYLWEFIYSQVMAEITQAGLGPDVYLFNEQWVVKGPDQGMKFSWHQDSGYVKGRDRNTKHKPYLTCWCTLDDVSEENGTVYMLPHSRGGTSHTIFDHEHEDGTNDLVGYKGEDPGIPIVAPAGSVVAFTSYNFHRSGANSTPRMRRIYLAQYSSEPIMSSDGSGLWSEAVPFVRDGEVIYDRAKDFA